MNVRGGRAGGRPLALAEDWMPERVWDLHTPQHVHEAAVSLLDEDGQLLDASLPQRFGFRELWIDGRDFYLNDTQVFLSALPLDIAQGSARRPATGPGEPDAAGSRSASTSPTHGYARAGKPPRFRGDLRAADDSGMLVALSQPHFGQYDWQMPDAAEKNGYAHHARFYVRVAGSHPCVVFYAMSHNSTGYSEDMNPDMIDGVHSERSPWSANNVERALQAEAIVARLDPSRIIYHHSSGNLSSMHTTNFYTNMAPSQELDDWFEHWATRGVKPVFTCEYMVPCTWDWTMYRGWYKGARAFGSAVVPWEFCLAEWSAQFLGDRAYRIGEPEKRNIRWEAEQFKRGRLWHRWDYPYQVGSKVFDQRDHRRLPEQLAGCLGRLGFSPRSTLLLDAPRGRRAASRSRSAGEPPSASRTTSASSTEHWTWPSSLRLDSHRRRAGDFANNMPRWPTSPASRRPSQQDHNSGRVSVRSRSSSS